MIAVEEASDLIDESLRVNNVTGDAKQGQHIKALLCEISAPPFRVRVELVRAESVLSDRVEEVLLNTGPLTRNSM